MIKKDYLILIDLLNNIKSKNINSNLDWLIDINKIKFDYNGRLIKLDLGNRSLNTIPKEVFLFSELKELDLENNALKEIPEDILLLKKLKNLNICDNYIEYITSNIINNINVRRSVNVKIIKYIMSEEKAKLGIVLLSLKKGSENYKLIDSVINRIF